MPAITVEAAKLTKEQKTQLIAELTDSTSKILGLPKDIIFVFLKENDPDNIGPAACRSRRTKNRPRSKKHARAAAHDRPESESPRP